MNIKELQEENTRLNLEIDRQNSVNQLLQAGIDQNNLLAELGRQALELTDMKEILRETLPRLSKVLFIQKLVAISFLDDQKVEIDASLGWQRPGIEESGIYDATDWCPEDWNPAQEQIALYDARTRVLPQEIRQNSELFCLYVGIPGKRKPSGCLILYPPGQRGFSQDEISFVQSVANVLGVAKDRFLANADAERLSADLARSNNDLQQFAYVAAHDLQEPLRAVLGYLSLLEEEQATNLNEKSKKYLNEAVAGARRMTGLISDLLAYSRLETRPNVPSQVDTRIVVKEVLDDLASLIGRTGSKIEVDDMPVIIADPFRIKQLFQNLVQNAIKFRGDSPPCIRITAKRENEFWLFSISDNGIGIDMKYADRIFLVFQRLHSRRLYEGSGIGLAVCKKVVEQYGGRIWFESEPQVGTTFRFTLRAVRGEKVCRHV